MTYGDFVKELASADISGREFARLLKLNPNTVANYKKRGDVPSHLAVIATLIRILTENGIPYARRLEALNIRPNAARGRSIAQP